jgi:glycogen debranching enzyme
MTIRDSTWMDHIDRRKSANDIQALFHGSLHAGVRLAELLGDDAAMEKWKKASFDLRERIDGAYWNPDSQYYYDTIRKDGSKDPSIRPNALVLVINDAINDRAKAEAILDRVEKPDLTTPWGVRTLSTSDPNYRPTLYHEGAVWPLVTGWAALSALKCGRSDSALAYISCMADRILSENGMFAETYRGDRPEPFNSCILQAWSAGMYAWAFAEMMTGLKIDLIAERIQLEPQIPYELSSQLSGPIRIRRPIQTRAGRAHLAATIDPANRKMSVLFKGKQRPQISSTTYEVTYSNG